MHFLFFLLYPTKSRTDKNIKFSQFYKYGDIQISINLSKPEKNPKKLLKARQWGQWISQCLLNDGFAESESF